MRTIVVAIAIVSVPLVASAHHSRAEFAGELIELQGELVDVDWSNPHPAFTVRVDERGQSILWGIQGYGSIYTLTRAGVTGEHFVPGDSVRLAGTVSTRRENLLLVTNILLSDGREIVFRRDADPIWADTAVGGEENFVAETSNLVDTAAENRGIFRVWSRPSQGSVSNSTPPLTEAAAAAAASWDELSDTSMACIPKGMPMAMRTPHPYEFIDRGDSIVIRGHEFNIMRTVHINDSTDPAGQTASPLGYSVGRWVDKDLVVETSRVNWPLYSGRGVPQSEAVRIVERFMLSEDQSRLDYRMSVTDPSTFVGTATFETYWVALGESPAPYDCRVDR